MATRLKKGPTAFDAMVDHVADVAPSAFSRSAPKLLELDLDKVRPRPEQPRRAFVEDALRELADSLGAKGLLQPVLVRPREGEPGTYDLVAGERRYRAARMLGWRAIAAIVTTGDAEELALIENLQRVDLTPLEEARGIRRLMETHAYTQEQAAKAVGKSRTAISQLMRILTLPDAVLAECEASHVSKSALLQVARTEDPRERAALLRRVREGASEKELRATRSGGAPRAAAEARGGEPVGLFLRGLARLRAAADKVAAADLDRARREEVRALRDRLNSLLGE